jgi:hypothetical protein
VPELWNTLVKERQMYSFLTTSLFSEKRKEYAISVPTFGLVKSMEWHYRSIRTVSLEDLLAVSENQLDGNVVLINGRNYNKPTRPTWLKTAHLRASLGGPLCRQKLEVSRLILVKDLERLDLKVCKRCLEYL